MILFFTQSVQYLAKYMPLPQGSFTVKHLNNGELYVKIDEDVKQKNIWIVASIAPPAENFLELFFLLDALKQNGALAINLFITYFSYTRQIIPLPGEAASTQILCNFFKNFDINKTYILHAHAASLLHPLLFFTDVIDIVFFCKIAESYDIIAAPDKGSFEFVKKIAQECNNKPTIFLQKVGDHEIKIESVEDVVENKKVLLVDDIISTGRTLSEAARMLKNLGASEVSAAATHGIFCPGSLELLEASQLKKIFVTNSLKQEALGNKIEVENISNFVISIINHSLL